MDIIIEDCSNLESDESEVTCQETCSVLSDDDGSGSTTHKQQQQQSTISKMEGLAMCKVCLGQTPRYNKHCHLCQSELGDRCWRCDYLCKPNSKFCFRCNVKLVMIELPDADSILPIPAFRPTQANSGGSALKSNDDAAAKLLVDRERKAVSIKSMIANINKTSEPTTPPASMVTGEKQNSFIKTRLSYIPAMSDSLGNYSVYCNYNQKSLDSLSRLPQVDNYISERPELRGLNLHSFLIKPVQRICKYPLLLRELLKATSADHPDHGQLILAVAKIEQIVNLINKVKMENETWQRTMQIIQSLKGSESLQLSKRTLMSEGKMQMVEGFNENSDKKLQLKYKKGFYFLFNDLFLFTKHKGSSYKLVKSIPLDNVIVHSCNHSDKHFFTIVEFGVGGERWTFYPPTGGQALALTTTMQRLIEKCWDNRYDGELQPKPMGNASPAQSPSPSKTKKLPRRLVKSLV
ncbi:hypothetical protein SAMD00019534_084710, partial [Acytostelium subglobosum LB1]|uniref:hypothetical protein n=1 Tax=Acytostelium subglobosum LB1 TaxID=1410327 RepID=UPI00064499C7